jgi:hypothetical protein
MNKKDNQLIYVSMMIISFVLLILSVFLFMNGVHNADLGQNINFLNAEFNLSLGDLASDLNVYSGTELYIKGMNHVVLSFFICLFSSLALGVSLRGLKK